MKKRGPAAQRSKSPLERGVIDLSQFKKSMNRNRHMN